MCSGATVKTTSSRSVFAPTIASGISLSIARASGCCATASGSTLLPPGFFTFCSLDGPVQHTLLIDVKKPSQNQADEQQHLPKGKEPQSAVNGGPGIEKDGFNIKENEHHRHQIKLHGKALAGRADGLHAGFIRGIFCRVWHTPAQNRGGSDHATRNRNCNQDLNQDRKPGVGVRTGHLLNPIALSDTRVATSEIHI